MYNIVFSLNKKNGWYKLLCSLRVIKNTHFAFGSSKRDRRYLRVLDTNYRLARNRKGQKYKVAQPRYVRDPQPYIYRAYSESNDSLLFRAGALPNEDRRKLPTLHLPRPIPTGLSFARSPLRIANRLRQARFVIVLASRDPWKSVAFVRPLLKAIIASTARTIIDSREWTFSPVVLNSLARLWLSCVEWGIVPHAKSTLTGQIYAWYTI